MMLIRAFALLLALAAGCTLSVNSAHAQSTTCTTSFNNVNLDGIDLTQNVAFPTFAQGSLTCTGLAGANAQACIELGAGSGGSAANLSSRIMLSGANQLIYNIFFVNGSTIWGAASIAGTASQAISFTIPSGGTFTSSFLAKININSGQQTLPTGTYASNFSGGANQTYVVAQNSSCNSSQAISAATPISGFSISATYFSSCTIQTHPLAFGTVDLTKDTAQSSSVDLTCSNGSSYTVSLDGGLAASSDPTRRQMKKGSESIVYGLYKDAAHSAPWGDGAAAGGTTLSQPGSGFTQSVPIYGLIARQASPSVGSYSDTVNVKVTY